MAAWSEADAVRIAVFTKNFTNPAYGAARLGAERAAARLGAQVLHFVPHHPDDAAEQAALIERALALQPRPDAFVLAPVHPTAVDGAIRRAAAEGVPLVGFVTPVLAAPTVASVSSDDEALGQAIAHYLFRHLRGSGRVLVVGGPPGAFTSDERLRGFHAAAAHYPDIRLEAAIAGDYDRGVARARAAEWLRVHGQVQGCLAANDVMALGVLAALAEAGRRAPVVGVNAIPEAVTTIRSGALLATADFDAMQMAALATECAVRHLRGEEVPERVILPVEIVDRSNAARWDRPYEERPLRTLDEWRAPA
jgi:ribose transport system substrate-binding protein